MRTDRLINYTLREIRRAPLFHVRAAAALALLIALTVPVYAQPAPRQNATEATRPSTELHGRVIDAETGKTLPGANVSIKNTLRGTATDADGAFVLRIDAYPATLRASFIGYESRELEVMSGDFVDIALEPTDVDMDDLVVVGARFAPRTVITSPVPIDNIKAADLITTGQPTFDKMLMYTVPAFNSTQQTVSDATAHFDPADLRGLGPSRTLVLVNGKRKNPSALVYINDTPGKGEVGVDMKSIPADAIARVEVLRDGASAQYGSDAIAGVINVILKDHVEQTTANVFSGATTEGDGFRVGYGLNTGFRLGQDGFLNLTHTFSDQEETDRAGTPGTDALFGVDGSDPFIQAHPDLGMRVGQPNMTQADATFNGMVPLAGSNAEVYGFGGLTYRRGVSYALYRTPYFVSTDFGLLTPSDEAYSGFQPTFETDIADRHLTAGVRGLLRGWDVDLSTTYGRNTVDYTIGNTVNVDLASQSPTTFQAGGYAFQHNILNLDMARRVFNTTFSAGTEFRTEQFVTTAGEEASFAGSGAQSFPGLQPRNEVDATRYNVGAYLDAGADLTENIFLGGAIRYESYSDFGDNVSWKTSGRVKFFDDRATVRGAVSTGFRAPSLHQIYLSNIQTLVSGGSVSNQGTFDNLNPVLRQLEVGRLKDEKALNLTGGIALQPVDGLYVSVDAYQVDVDDRVVYSSSIASSDNTMVVGSVLDEFNITSLKFFVNAVDTRTRGIDLVANYNALLPVGRLTFNLAANVNDTEIRGNIATPAPIAATGIDLFDRKEQSRILTARPRTKMLFGITYAAGDLRATVNNTRFGAVSWQHATDPSNDQTFDARLVTDLDVDYQLTPLVRLGVSVNNLFNVYPEAIDSKGDPLTDLGGRFRYPWEVNQFGFNGTTVTGNLNITF